MADGEFADYLICCLRTFLPNEKLFVVKGQLREEHLHLSTNGKYQEWIKTLNFSNREANIRDQKSNSREELAASIDFLIHCVDPTMDGGHDYIEGGWEKKDMMEYCNHALAVMRICHTLLSTLCGDDGEDKSENDEIAALLSLRKFLMKRSCSSLILLCAVHAETHVWTSETSTATAKELLTLICANCQCTSVRELLSGCIEVDSQEVQTGRESERHTANRIFPSGLLRHVLDYLRPFLSKDTWKKSPLLRHGFVWCTQKVKHPYLGEHFPKLMPPLLLFIDDYEVENKVLGLTCLKHVVDNVNSAELLWYGRADVLYEAVQRLVYTNEPSLLLALYPCVLSILAVIEPPLKKPKLGRRTSKCDSVFQIILSSMEFESKIAMRRAYACSLKDFVEHMGITVLRHFKRLLRVMTSYLEVSDYPGEEARLSILDSLSAVMLHTWPRIPNHSSSILKTLLRLIVDVEDAAPHITDQAYQQLKDKTRENMFILLRCCGKQVEDQLTELKKGVGHKVVEDCVMKVLQQAALEDGVTTSTHELDVM